MFQDLREQATGPFTVSLEHFLGTSSLPARPLKVYRTYYGLLPVGSVSLFMVSLCNNHKRNHLSCSLFETIHITIILSEETSFALPSSYSISLSNCSLHVHTLYIQVREQIL